MAFDPRTAYFVEKKSNAFEVLGILKEGLPFRYEFRKNLNTSGNYYINFLGVNVHFEAYRIQKWTPKFKNFEVEYGLPYHNGRMKVIKDKQVVILRYTPYIDPVTGFLRSITVHEFDVLGNIEKLNQTKDKEKNNVHKSSHYRSVKWEGEGKEIRVQPREPTFPL